MKPQFTVEQRLQLESLRRGVNGTSAQIIMLIFMMIMVPDFSAKIFYNVAAFILIIILAARWLIFKKNKNPHVLIEKAPWGIYLALSTAFLWAFLLGLAVYAFGVSSVTGLIHVFLTCGLLAAVMYSLSPTPKLQRFYVLILGMTVSAVIYFSDISEYRTTGTILALFVYYLFMASRSHSSDLRSTFELEEELVRKNARLQEVVDSVPGFMILISEKGNWLQTSSASQEVIKSPKLDKEIQTFLKSGQEKAVMELELGINGENCFVVSFEKVRSGEGGIIVFGLPIDELKKMRQELEIQKAKADYSERLAGIGMMASGVAHEISNPLAIISLNTETLRLKLGQAKVDESIWQKRTTAVLETVSRIAHIIKSLQQLSREDVAPEKSDVDLNTIIKDVIDVSLERIKILRAELFYEDQGPLWVKGKHSELGQILLNLINNSLDAIKSTPLKKIYLDIKDAGDEYVLELTDTGEGIPPDVEKNIFQPFFSTKPVGSGVGLGLPTSRSIILSYGGGMALINAKNPTIFQVKIKKSPGDSTFEADIKQ